MTAPKLTDAQRKALAYQDDPDTNARFARRKLTTMRELVDAGLVLSLKDGPCFWDDWQITDAGRAALRGE